MSLLVVLTVQLGRLRFIDTVKLDPKNQNLKFEGILGNLRVVSTIYIVIKESFVHDLHYEIAKIKVLGARGKISGGISVLPAKQGMI